MSDGGPYTLLWIGLGRWRLSIRYRPSWGAWFQRTELLLVGFGIEEGG